MLKGIQQKIQENIRYFDLGALLRLLHGLGYEEKDIYFRSHPSLASPSSLCEEISFSDARSPRVTILVNLGLFCGTTPLPSFFRKKMDSGSIDPELFARFLGFFDHFVLANLFALEPSYGWVRNIRANYLNLIALNSVSSLSHLFQLCFPELKVEITKMSRVSRIQNESISLGKAHLGKGSFLGKRQQHTISGFKILFMVDETETKASHSWAKEIENRMGSLLSPVLRKVDVFLTISLVMKQQRVLGRISRASYLGYLRLGESDVALEIPLFSGYPREAPFLKECNI